LVLANTLWVGTYTAGKVALGQLSFVELNALCFLLPALLLTPVLTRDRRQVLALARDWQALLVLTQLTLLGWLLNKTLEYAGLALSTTADVALLIATESLFAMLLSWMLVRERVTRAAVAALAAGTLGACLIVARGLSPDLSSGVAALPRILGDLLVILSLFIEAVYTIKGKTMLDRWPPLLFTALTITGSLLFWLPVGSVAVARGGWPHLSPLGMLAVLYAGWRWSMARPRRRCSSSSRCWGQRWRSGSCTTSSPGRRCSAVC
jgi:drug/metabolite transporter (DMT)-like permease